MSTSPKADAPPDYSFKEEIVLRREIAKNDDPGEIQLVSDVSSSERNQFDPKDSVDEENGDENNEPKAPDGGFGWVIVFAVFMIHVVLDGVNFSFGILYPFLIDEMKTTQAAASAVVSTLMGVTFFCGPFSSVLSTKFGHRSVALCGAIIAFCGAVGGYFATQIWHLIISYGAVMGIGFGGIYLPAIVSAVSWFDKRRARAVGIAVCGSGFGIMIFSFLVPYLIGELGLHGYFLIQSAIICNTIVFASLLRPLPHLEKAGRKLKNGSRRPSLEMDEIPKAGEKVLKVKEVTEAEERGFFGGIVNTVRNMAIFRMWQYWVMLLVVFLCGLSGYIPFVYINDRVEKEAQIASDRSKLIVFVTGGFNLFGRLAAGITDHPWINRLLVYSSAYIVSGIATVFSVYCYDLVTFGIYGAVYGFTGGIIIALQSVVLADIVGNDNLSTAFGISLFVLGIAALCGPPIAGEVVASQGGTFTLTFILFGIMMAAGGVIFLVVPITKMIQRRRNPPQMDTSVDVETSKNV